MKTLYVRVIADNIFGYELVKCNDYKDYPEYGVSIIKYNDTYSIVDTNTGLNASRRYYKLKDAKSFMDHTEEINFINWYKKVEEARTTEAYKSKILRVR